MSLKLCALTGTKELRTTSRFFFSFFKKHIYLISHLIVLRNILYKLSIESIGGGKRLVSYTVAGLAPPGTESF